MVRSVRSYQSLTSSAADVLSLCQCTDSEQRHGDRDGYRRKPVFELTRADADLARVGSRDIYCVCGATLFGLSWFQHWLL